MIFHQKTLKNAPKILFFVQKWAKIVIFKLKKNAQRAFYLIEYVCGLSYIFFCSCIVNKDLTSVVQLPLMPMCSVVQMCFTCCWASGNLRGSCFVMGTPFISSCFRDFSFRMCHFLCYLSVNNFFNESQRGSVSLSEFLLSKLFGLKSSNVSSISEFSVPSLMPG